MACCRPASRFLVLSSDAADQDDDATRGDTSQLPPSDPPDPVSGSESESESEARTPIQKLPSLFSRFDAQASSPTPPSPRRPQRVFRNAQHSSSLPPPESPRAVREPTEHQTSDNILYTPSTTKRILNERKQLKRQETLRAVRADKVCILLLLCSSS
jgi:hypothetical protein